MIKKELTTNIEWEYENYKYSHSFSLERMGAYISSITEKDKEIIKPEFLYKFYDLNDYSLNSLLEGYLYFSNPKNFNDPFDCLVNREKHIINRGSEAIKRHRENIGVCCFSLENNNPLMWGHYTNSYSGFCLKFENESLLRDKKIAIKSHVAYLKDYKPANENLEKVITELNSISLNDEYKEFIRKILTMVFEYCWKLYDWKYEKEFRAISINSKSFDNKLNFDKKTVKEIYIGQLMKIKNPNSYNFLMHILKIEYPHVKIFEVKPHPLFVKLEFNEINN
jgi:hypothetical protein